MINNINVGKIGEGTVCEFLVKKGWKIIARNYRQKWGEIDIITKANDGVLVFCEVKTLLVGNIGIAGGLVPEDNLTANKLKKLNRTSQIFANQHPNLVNPEKGWRIDLVAVELEQSKSGHSVKEVRHYENIA